MCLIPLSCTIKNKLDFVLREIHKVAVYFFPHLFHLIHAELISDKHHVKIHISQWRLRLAVYQSGRQTSTLEIRRLRLCQVTCTKNTSLFKCIFYFYLLDFSFLLSALLTTPKLTSLSHVHTSFIFHSCSHSATSSTLQSIIIAFALLTQCVHKYKLYISNLKKCQNSGYFTRKGYFKYNINVL